MQHFLPIPAVPLCTTRRHMLLGVAPDAASRCHGCVERCALPAARQNRPGLCLRRHRMPAQPACPACRSPQHRSRPIQAWYPNQNPSGRSTPPLGQMDESLCHIRRYRLLPGRLQRHECEPHSSTRKRRITGPPIETYRCSPVYKPACPLHAVVVHLRCGLRRVLRTSVLSGARERLVFLPRTGSLRRDPADYERIGSETFRARQRFLHLGDVPAESCRRMVAFARAHCGRRMEDHVSTAGFRIEWLSVAFVSVVL